MYYNRNGEQVWIRGIKDLKRGDKVFVTTWERGYIEVTVARVRTVECATIVTVMKCDGVNNLRYVGYHTDDKACGSINSVLTISRYSAGRVKRSLEDADKVSDAIASRAEALHAMKVLRSWLSGSDSEVFANR